MMNNFFVRRPIFAMVVSIIIVIMGLMSIKSLPVEQYPNITPPVVEVSASYQGADAITVNESVAVPIAQSIMGVDNLMYMQATSSNDGSMSLQATFDIGSDVDMSTVFTQNRVSTATPMLPSSVKQQGVSTTKTMNSFLMVYSLYSDGRYDDIFLSNYAVLNIKNELLKIDGVGKVNVLGAGNYSMRVWIEPDKLHFMDISVDDVVSAIESQSGVYPAGKIGAQPDSKTDFTYTVVLPTPISTPQEYGNIIIRTLDNGTQVKLNDVARVEFGAQSYGVNSSFNNLPAAMVMIYQTPGSNALEVGNEIKSTIANLSTKFLQGISMDIITDTTQVISTGIKEILMTLIIALVLVIFVIYVFLQDLRAMIIPLISIPVALIGAFMLFPLLDFSINVFSLLGLVLAIGLVVDDAIVVVEAVQLNIEKGMNPKEATVEAMKSVSAPIIATTIVLTAVFIPVSLMGGITGLMYRQFAITITFSVIISAFNALTLSPALCSIWLRKKEPSKRGFFGFFNKWFSNSVDKYLGRVNIIVRHSTRSLLFIALVIVVVISLGKVIPTGFLPTEDQGFLMTSVTLPNAASLERTTQTSKQIYDIISKRKDVVCVGLANGFNMLSGIESSNSAIIFIKLTDYNTRKSSAVIADELNEQLYLEINSGTTYTFGPPAIPGIGSSSGFTVMIQDNGSNTMSYLADNSYAFIDKLKQRKEIGMAYTEFNDDIPQRKLVIDNNAASSQGVDMGSLNSIVSTFLGGRYINNFNRFGQLYQTYIQAEGKYRQSPEDLNNYYIVNNKGNSVPLSSFVSIKDTSGVEYVTLYNLYNAITVMGNSAKGYSSSQALDAIEEVAKEVLPNDISYSFSGMSYQEKTASGKGSMVYISALIFMFLVLAALYESWTMPFTVLLGIPFALFGALLFVYIAYHINPLLIDNIFFQVSLIMLIGLAAKNAILIIEYAKDKYNSGKSLYDAIIEAVKLRVRPIMMTAFAFIMGVMPLIFATGANSQARNVMGVALVGGMLIATFIGLFIYPMVYVMIGKFDERRKKRKNENI